MRYGITGSKGFLGRSLYFKLSKKTNKSNILLRFDTRNTNIPDNLDVIFHLGYSSVMSYQINHQMSLKSDIDSAESIAKYCQKNATQLIFISSAAVYNDKTRDNYYAQSKIKIENLFLEYFSSKFFPLTIVRLFNSYGPGQSTEFVIPQIISSLLQKQRLIIHQPKSKRDFIYIDDFSELISHCPKNEHEPYIFNLKTGYEITIEDLVKLISKKVNVDYRNYINCKSEGIDYNFSIDKNVPNVPADYNFNFTLENGLNKTIDFYTAALNK